MDPQLEQLLERLYEAGREHDAVTPDRRERRRNVEPESVRMLAVLVRTLRPQRMLELGTSNGYSTIWLADAARAVGARLTTGEARRARRICAAQGSASTSSCAWRMHRTRSRALPTTPGT
jgi:predicted O-methyltransferase YrrM